jgi:hypothetical protein
LIQEKETQKEIYMATTQILIGILAVIAARIAAKKNQSK